MNWQNGHFTLSDEASRLDLDTTCSLLNQTYWAGGRSRATVEKSLRHSLNFGLFEGPEQIGFARVVTDYATHSYLCDVVIAPSHRGGGLGTWMLECILAHPELQTTRMDLFTKDAHAFYRKFGFKPHRFDCLVHYTPDYAGGSDWQKKSQSA